MNFLTEHKIEQYADLTAKIAEVTFIFREDKVIARIDWRATFPTRGKAAAAVP